MGSFSEGMRIGQMAFDAAENRKRQAKQDEREDYRFQREQQADQRANQDRADLGRVSQGLSLQGLDPGAAQAGPSGMGPVAPPDALATKLDEGGVQNELGKIMLRQGNVAGYNGTQDRAKALAKEARAKEFGKWLSTAPDEEVFAKLGPQVNGPGTPIMMGYDPESKKLVVTHPDGSITKMSSAEARQHLYAAHQMGEGDIAAGVTAMSQAAAAQQARVDRAVTQGNAVATGLHTGQHQDDTLAEQGRHSRANEANAAAQTAETAAYHRGELGLRGAQMRQSASQHAESVGLQRERLNMERTKEVELVDENGNAVLGYARFDPKTGQTSYSKADLPAGLKLPPRGRAGAAAAEGPKDADVLKLAERYTGKNPDTGKPYTPEESYAKAYRALQGKGADTSGVDIDMDKFAAALKGVRAGGPGAAAPQQNVQQYLPQNYNAGQAAPPVQNPQRFNQSATPYAPGPRGLNIDPATLQYLQRQGR